MFCGRTIPRIRKLKIGTLQNSKYVPLPQLFLHLIFYFALAQIDPNRRHVDKSVVAHSWKMLDSWIQVNNPSLVKQAGTDDCICALFFFFLLSAILLPTLWRVTLVVTSSSSSSCNTIDIPRFLPISLPSCSFGIIHSCYVLLSVALCILTLFLVLVVREGELRCISLI